MLDLNLSGDDYRAFLKALADPHSVRVDVSILTLDGDELSRITPLILDGQVDVDADADVTRSLSITLLDQTHSLHLDSDSPSDGALYADRMVRVTYSVLVPALDDRVDVDVFTGPIIDLERDGDQVSLTAHGKEELGTGAWIWRPLTIKKGARKTDAITTILAERAGETDFDIPDLKTRLPKAVVLGRAAAAWPHARKIAESMNRQLFYNGSGVCRLRVRPRRPVFTFLADDADANMLSRAKVTHDFTEIKNTVWFRGGKPKGQKKAVEYPAVAPKGHPLSPYRLGRTNADGNRISRYLVHEASNDNVRSKAEAKKRAQALLDDMLLETLNVTFTAVPIPHLEPLDVVRVSTRDFSANVRIRQFSLPLAGGEMTVGYIDAVSRPNLRRIRRRVRRGAA
jgi:hypothetical protein